MTEKNYFANNLKYLRQKKNMEQIELAELLNRKSSSSISEWEKGKYKPKAGLLSDIASIFNVTLSDLMEKDLTSSQLKSKTVEAISSTLQKVTQTTSKLHPKRQENVLDYAKDQLNEQETEGNNKNTVTDNVVKLFDYDYYDQPASAGTGQYLNDVRVETISLPVDVNADFVIPIYGDSMEPEFYSGDYVFIKQALRLSDGEIGVFECCGDAYIKQLILEENRAYLHSLNQNGDYPDIRIDSNSDFRIIGKVIDVYREPK